MIPKCMAWLDDELIRDLNTIEDKVDNPSPQSTPQVLSSFEVYTPPVTHPEDVEETIRIPIEVEPLNETKLEEVGLNGNHNTPLSSRKVLSFDGPKPQPLLNSLSLDVSLGDVIGPEPPIKPHSPDSSRMKVVDYLTTQRFTLHGNFYPKGVDISNWEMFDDDWGLESKEVCPLGEELSLFDRPNEVERGLLTKSILVDACSLAFDPYASTLNFDPHASTLALEDASDAYALANIHALAFSMSFQEVLYESELLLSKLLSKFTTMISASKIKISDMIQNDVWVWPEEWVASYSNILSIPNPTLNNVVDKVYWVTKDGKKVLGLKVFLMLFELLMLMFVLMLLRSYNC
ncbi:ribonuclease H-like domain-containing protein [Tanacetum coccineum]